MMSEILKTMNEILKIKNYTNLINYAGIKCISPSFCACMMANRLGSPAVRKQKGTVTAYRARRMK